MRRHAAGTVRLFRGNLGRSFFLQFTFTLVCFMVICFHFDCVGSLLQLCKMGRILKKIDIYGQINQFLTPIKPTHFLFSMYEKNLVTHLTRPTKK